MENRSDYEKRLGEKLEAAYMLEDIEPGMSREEFHRLILAAEKRKKRRRSLLGLAAACVALCLVCGGFMAGMTMRESASAGKDGETKIVQQGDSVIIGSGASENNQNVGVSTKTYTDIEDIPEEVRKEIHFLDSDEFELEKVKIVEGENIFKLMFVYMTKENERVEVDETQIEKKDQISAIGDVEQEWMYKGIKIFEKKDKDVSWYGFVKDNKVYNIRVYDFEIKVETILDGLIN